MLNPWRSELSLILLALLIGAFLGKLFHHPWLSIWVVVLVYLAHSDQLSEGSAKMSISTVALLPEEALPAK